MNTLMGPCSKNVDVICTKINKGSNIFTIVDSRYHTERCKCISHGKVVVVVRAGGTHLNKDRYQNVNCTYKFKNESSVVDIETIRLGIIIDF